MGHSHRDRYCLYRAKRVPVGDHPIKLARGKAAQARVVRVVHEVRHRVSAGTTGTSVPTDRATVSRLELTSSVGDSVASCATA
jgi:hypothetical protein